MEEYQTWTISISPSGTCDHLRVVEGKIRTHDCIGVIGILSLQLEYMQSVLEKIKDPKLKELAGCLKDVLSDEEVAKRFGQIKKEFPNYDPDFLWILSYPEHSWATVSQYIDLNYKKFHKYLDSGFADKISKKFGSRLWEMLLCDMFFPLGKLLQKKPAGADFILETVTGEQIQIEAVAPDEAGNLSLRSVRPDYSVDNFSTVNGKIEDLERPVLLRFLQGFDDKSKTKTYDGNKPLIIAINTHKAVGYTSRDNYIIRQVLFGLGCETITRMTDGSYKHGLQFKPSLNKPEMPEFAVARFRDAANRHVSGVIYTSQNPAGLVPNGWGWSNYGITYVPNQNATHKVNMEFPFFRKIICDESIYKEIDAEQSFQSSLNELSYK